MARGVPKTSPPPSILVPKETKKRVVKTGVANFWWEKCWTCFFFVCVLLGNSPAISCRNLSFWLDLFFLSHLVFAFPAFFFGSGALRQNPKSLRAAFDNGKMRAVVLSSGLKILTYSYIYIYTPWAPQNLHF